MQRRESGIQNDTLLCNLSRHSERDLDAVMHAKFSEYRGYMILHRLSLDAKHRRDFPISISSCDEASQLRLGAL